MIPSATATVHPQRLSLTDSVTYETLSIVGGKETVRESVPAMRSDVPWSGLRGSNPVFLIEAR
jgi:hypothetical protein